MASTVLIVDDHPTFRRFARRLLEETGLDVVGEAVDGESALRSVAALAPDLVLLDVMLPTFPASRWWRASPSSVTDHAWCSSRRVIRRSFRAQRRFGIKAGSSLRASKTARPGQGELSHAPLFGRDWYRRDRSGGYGCL